MGTDPGSASDTGVQAGEEKRTALSSYSLCYCRASGLSALLLYWLFEIPYYGAIFELGILAFLVLLIADVVMEMADNIRYRMETQAYERLVREDGLTGFETRTGFEKALEEMVVHTGEYQIFFLFIFILIISALQIRNSGGDWEMNW